MSSAIEPVSRINEAAAAYGTTGTRMFRRPAAAMSAPAADGGAMVQTDAGSAARRLTEQYAERDERAQDSVLREAVDSTNASLQLAGRSLRFRISEDSGEVQIQVVDSESDKVIRSIPSDDMISLSQRLRELTGLGAMVDHFR